MRTDIEDFHGLWVPGCAVRLGGGGAWRTWESEKNRAESSRFLGPRVAGSGNLKASAKQDRSEGSAKKQWREPKDEES